MGIKSFTFVLAVAFSANAGTLFSDLGTGSSVYDPSPGSIVKGSGAGGNNITQARPFTVSGTGDFLVSQIDLAVLKNGGASTFAASIWTSASNLPGTELGSWDLSTSFDPNTCCGLVTQTGITGVTLTGGTQYFMLLGPQALGDATDVAWQGNTLGLTGSQLGSLDGGATWIADGTGPQRAFDVLGNAAVPEPATIPLLAAGCAALLPMLRRRGRR